MKPYLQFLHLHFLISVSSLMSSWHALQQNHALKSVNQRPECTSVKSQSNHLPLHFVSTLSDEESLSVRQNLHAARVDGDFAIVALVAALYLDRKKQQLEFGEAKPVEGTEKEVQERFEISKHSTTGVSSVVIFERVTNMSGFHRQISARLFAENAFMPQSAVAQRRACKGGRRLPALRGLVSRQFAPSGSEVTFKREIGKLTRWPVGTSSQ